MAVFQIPRGPLYVGKAEQADLSDDYTKSMLMWRDAAREEAVDTLNMNPEYQEVQAYIDVLEGRQWAANRPKYRSRLFDNRLFDMRLSTISLLTDIRPTIDVSASVEAYKHQAEIAEKIILAEWTRQQLDIRLADVVDHAMFGTGYWKLGAMMPGRLTVVACGMDSVLPIQPGPTLQESSAIMYRTYKPVQWFRNIWGHKADGLEKESTSASWTNSSNDYVRPGHIPEYTWNALSPAMRYHLGIRSLRRTPHGSQDQFPVIELEEYWVDDPEINESSEDVLVQDPDIPLSQHNYWYRVGSNERLWPRKRHIVFAGDRIMHDGPSPYWHGLYPFANLMLMPVVWAPSGLSKYRNQLPINQAINHIGAGINDVIERVIRPQMISKDGVVRDATWNKFFADMPGGKLKLNANAQVGQDVRYMDPPVIPSYTQQHLGGYLIPTFNQRAGTMDMSALTKKKQVPGADSIEQMRDSMTAPFRMESRYVESFLIQAGIQAISNIFQYYTWDQRMRMLGADGQTWEDFDYDPRSMVPSSQPKEDHWKLFSILIKQGSLHGASKDREKMMAIQLAKMNKISLRELYRRLEVANGDQIIKEMAEEAKIMGAMQQHGRTPRGGRGERTGKEG